MESITQVSDWAGKRVWVRLDLNVPIENGHILDDSRIQATLPTLQWLLEQGAHLVILSHLGRPKVGQFDPLHSLAPIATHLCALLKKAVHFYHDSKFSPESPDWSHPIGMMENVRFWKGETENDTHLAQHLAAMGDRFVFDAFGCAHRAHATTKGLASLLPSYTGLLVSKEVETLLDTIHNPKRPLLLILGGAKISTKLTLLSRMLPKCDHCILGGGLANTLIAAQGYPIGKSLYEPEYLDAAKHLLQEFSSVIHLPTDVITSINSNTQGQCHGLEDIPSNEAIFDVGPLTQQRNAERIQYAKTILWNGPLGLFESPYFSKGTVALLSALSKRQGQCIAGGGDSLYAAEKLGFRKAIDIASTGGGAFLTLLEKQTFPCWD